MKAIVPYNDPDFSGSLSGTFGIFGRDIESTRFPAPV